MNSYETYGACIREHKPYICVQRDTHPEAICAFEKAHNSCRVAYAGSNQWLHLLPLNRRVFLNV